MRVWALASCGGLLALTACSTDQANTTNPTNPPPDGDRLSQGKILPPTATPRPLAQPEMPPRQTPSARPRLNPAAVSGGADRTALQSQSAQLRARLQLLRDRQGTRLASSTPVAAAPIPRTDRVATSPIPQPGAPILLQAESTPGASRGSRLAIAPPPHSAAQSPLLATPTPLPSPQPTVIKADVESSGTTADLQPVVVASIANSYPIAPLRHQGHSARPSARHSAQLASPQVLVPPSTSQPIAASVSLHRSMAPALATQPNADTAEQVSGTTATLVPNLAQDSAALLASASRAAISREHAASQSRAGSPVTLTHPGDFPGGAAGGAHRQESTPPLRSAERVPLQASLAPRPGSRATGGQNLGAIALPESLPLNSAAPRLSPLRPQLSPAQPTVSPPTAAPLAASRSVSIDRATTEPTAAPFAVSAGEHLSPADQDGFHLVPSASQSSKGLPLAPCSPASAHPPTADRLVDGAIAQPSFSGRNQSMTLGKDAPLAHCWSNALTQNVALEPAPAAALAPNGLDFSAAEAADLDLGTLAPDLPAD